MSVLLLRPHIITWRLYSVEVFWRVNNAQQIKLGGVRRYCPVVKIGIFCCEDNADGGHILVTGITARASEAVKCNEML